MANTPRLIIVAADKAYETVMGKILARPGDAGFGPFEFKIVVDPYHDSSPKLAEEVFETLMKHYGIPPANWTLGFLAERESLQDCRSRSFNRLRERLRQGFPAA